VSTATIVLLLLVLSDGRSLLGIWDEARLMILVDSVGGARNPFALSLIIMISEGEDFMDWSTPAKKELHEPSLTMLLMMD
jgi:hypothetical protein